MPVTVVRPNADSNGTWSRVPASGGRFDKLNDDTDSTYISSPAAGSLTYQGIGFGSTTILATQRIRAMQFGMRYKFTTAGYVELRFIRSGNTNSKTAIVQQSSTITAGGTVYSTYFANDPAGQEWTQGSLDSLELRLYDKATTGAGRVAVYELYTNVDIKNQPTITAPTVTGNTTTSRPTVAWVYSDTDGDPQSAWDLRVFTAAQYGIAGFDPGSSPATYSTVNVHRDDAATFQIPVDLVNAVTYKVYVRAAKIFNGANWASVWTASSAFTMAFEPVPAPTLTVVSDNTVPRVRNRIQVDTKLNLLTSDDASFEAGIGSWTGTSNATVVPSATFAAKGVQSMRMTATAGADMTATTGFYPVAPSTSYTFLSQFRTAVTARSVRAEVLWFDGAGVQIGATVAGSSVTDSSANFNTQATLTATSPAGALQMKQQARVLAAAAAEVHYNDANSYSTSASTTWYAGGASQVDYQLVEFTDLTPQNSPVVNMLQPQLALGGEANLNADGFYVRYNKDFASFDPTQSQTGEGSIRWDVGTNTTSRLDIGSPFGGDITGYLMPAVPGVQYTLSYYVMAGSGTHSLRLVLNSLDQTGAVLGATNGTTNTTITTAFQRLTVTHTATAGAIGMRAFLENINGDLTTYYLDAGQLEEGASATVWHEGQGVAPAWQPVRGALTGLIADQRNGIATCYDREAPPGVTRLYRATNVVAYPSGTNGASPASSWVSARLSLLDGGLSVVLKDPQNPAHDLKIRAPAISESIGEDLNELHPVRPNAAQAFGQRPVITSDWVSGVGGSISVQITDDHEWFRLLQMLETKSALLLQFPEGGQRYVRLTGDRSWTREPIGTDGRMTRPSRWSRVVNLSFAEVDRPPVLA